jgi:hypothetical protein
MSNPMSIELTRKLPRRFSSTVKIPQIVTRCPFPPDKFALNGNLFDLEREKLKNKLAMRQVRGERDASAIVQNSKHSMNKVNLRSNLERIYEVEEGLKYFNGVLDNRSRAKIEGKLGLLKNQRDHLESEIKSYERILDRNVRGGTSYEGYKNSVFYQKLEDLKQKNHEIDKDVVETNRIYDENYNFNVQWSRAKALIDNLEQQKQH